MGFSSCGERSVCLSPFDPALVTSENSWLHLLFIPGGAALRAFQYWGRSAPTGLAACNIALGVQEWLLNVHFQLRGAQRLSVARVLQPWWV